MALLLQLLMMIWFQQPPATEIDWNEYDKPRHYIDWRDEAYQPIF